MKFKRLTCPHNLSAGGQYRNFTYMSYTSHTYMYIGSSCSSYKVCVHLTGHLLQITYKCSLTNGICPNVNHNAKASCSNDMALVIKMIWH